MSKEDLSEKIAAQIKDLSAPEMESIILSYYNKDVKFRAWLCTHYLNKEGGESAIFQSAMIEIKEVLRKKLKGHSLAEEAAYKMRRALKVLKSYSVANKPKKFELDLRMHLLNHIYYNYYEDFGTNYKAFDLLFTRIVQRCLTLLNKMHPDYRSDYREEINMFLNILNEKSKHIKVVSEIDRRI